MKPFFTERETLTLLQVRDRCMVQGQRSVGWVPEDCAHPVMGFGVQCLSPQAWHSLSSPLPDCPFEPSLGFRNQRGRSEMGIAKLRHPRPCKVDVP